MADADRIDRKQRCPSRDASTRRLEERAWSRTKHSLYRCTMSIALFLSVTTVQFSMATAHREAVNDLRPGRGKMTSTFVPQPKVIGGQEAVKGRYPYFVALLSADRNQVCGGSLVAPDMVLTAAHCQGYLSFAHVGRWDMTNPGDECEEFRIVESDIVHPLYDPSRFPYDIMLLKLSGKSTKPIVALNDDPALPVPGIDEGVRIMGFGHTEYNNEESASMVLQEADVDHISNEVCEQSKFNDYSYQGLITDDMLCARDINQDSCKGDSGGPLIIAGNSYSSDLQVGIVSWGYGCALPSFPGVYSRISQELSFIKSAICQHSDFPPAAYECPEDETFNQPGPNTLPITVTINTDNFPMETGWSIRLVSTNALVVDVPAGTYTEKQTKYTDLVYLEASESYEFKIIDTFGDGMCCDPPGSYELTVSQHAHGGILANGGDAFDSVETRTFTMPGMEQEQYQDESTVIVGTGQIALTVQIQLDIHPTETGWLIEKLGLQTEDVVRVPSGIYTTRNEMIEQTVVLEEGELYSFRVTDIIGDGINDGLIRLFLGATETSDPNAIVFTSTGNFESLLEYTFIASFEDAQATASPEPTESFLTLVLRMDQYPEEVALQLRRELPNNSAAVGQDIENDSEIVFFRPSRFYKGAADQSIEERIAIPDPPPGSSSRYTFIITDSYGDGMCCKWVGTLETGYSLYEGEPLETNLIATSRFEDKGRESVTFDVFAEDAETPQQLNGLTPTVMREIKVKMTLDDFPDEIGLVIENLDGEKFIDNPAGTFANRNSQIVEEVVRVPVGQYRLSITDVFGDGLKGSDSYIDVSYSDDPDDAPIPIIREAGAFSFGLTRVFTVCDPAQKYPVSVKFHTDQKPEEFGFHIYRMDTLHASALVASIPPGMFTIPAVAMDINVNLEQNGLYKIVFRDIGKNGIGGIIVIEHGVDKQMTLDADDFREFPIKLYSGELPDTSIDPYVLDLRVQMDKFPHELEWVMLGHDDEQTTEASTKSSVTATSSTTSVLDYGPVKPFSPDLAGALAVQQIRLPAFTGSKTFTLILLDGAGDGVCCQFGQGGPIELFDGRAGDGEPILTDPFEDAARAEHTFTLMGDSQSNDDTDGRSGAGAPWGRPTPVWSTILVQVVVVTSAYAVLSIQTA